MNMKYRIIVTGSRKFQNRQLFHDTLSPFFELGNAADPHFDDNLGLFQDAMEDQTVVPTDDPGTVIIHGGASGLDSVAQDWCESLGVESEVFPANWKMSPRGAGAIRNRQMLRSGVDLCIAFPLTDVKSSGTMDMINVCDKAGVKTIIVHSASTDVAPAVSESD